MKIEPRRAGKSALIAHNVAKALRRGERLMLARIDENGESVMEPIVAVPGFADGRQLPDFTGDAPESPSAAPEAGA